MFSIASVFAVSKSPATLFEPLFAQRAALAVLLVCVIAASIGPAVVLRDLPFFAHAVGAGAYPALVLAVAAGVSLALAGIAGGLVFALLLWALTRGSAPDRRDSAIGIAVAVALGLGAVFAATVASDNLRLSAPPESLLFGSVLTVDAASLWIAAIAAALIAVAAWLAGARWLAAGFDAGSVRALGLQFADALLLPVVALASCAILPLTGSLLAGSLLVVPAAAARVLTRRAGPLVATTFAIALIAGFGGLYASLAFDLPAGATIAGSAAALFVIAALGAAARSARPRAQRPVLVAAGLAGMTLAIAGCGGSDTSATAGGAEELPRVVATTTQVADIVRNVGGEQIDLTRMVAAGVDPHEYEPKPSAVAALASAAAVFRSGGDIDGWVDAAVKASGNDKRPIDLSNAATLIPDAGGENVNAHWFLSPANLAAAARRTRDELVKDAPSTRETFRANAASYIDEIERVDGALRRCAAKPSQSQLTIVTGHDDFDYLARDYGIEIAARLADTGEAQPSARALQHAVDKARSAGARAVAVSRGESSKIAEHVAQELDVPLLGLYADSLATSGIAATALGAIAYDLGRIVEAVTGGDVKCPA